MTDRCEACGSNEALDKAHIKSKGAGGSMDDDNIIMLCRSCHRLQHQSGWENIIDQYPFLEHNLRKRGFKLVDEFGVTKLRKQK